MSSISPTNRKGRVHMRPSIKRDRINARLDPDLKELIERAAAFSGQSLSQFILMSARIAAEQTIRDHEIIALSVRDSRAVMDALQQPAKPSSRLYQAAERYKDLMGESE